jgi:hypothetical protein
LGGSAVAVALAGAAVGVWFIGVAAILTRGSGRTSTRAGGFGGAELALRDGPRLKLNQAKATATSTSAPAVAK